MDLERAEMQNHGCFLECVSWSWQQGSSVHARTFLQRPKNSGTLLGAPCSVPTAAPALLPEASLGAGVCRNPELEYGTTDASPDANSHRVPEDPWFDTTITFHSRKLERLAHTGTLPGGIRTTSGATVSVLEAPIDPAWSQARDFASGRAASLRPARLETMQPRT